MIRQAKLSMLQLFSMKKFIYTFFLVTISDNITSTTTNDKRCDTINFVDEIKGNYYQACVLWVLFRNSVFFSLTTHIINEIYEKTERNIGITIINGNFMSHKWQTILLLLCAEYI